MLHLTSNRDEHEAFFSPSLSGLKHCLKALHHRLPDLDDKNLPLLMLPGEKAASRPQSALGAGGNWILVFLCPPLAPLCSHCWRCHHQHSNKAQATSAFSTSLFTLMTSCRSEHTQLLTYRMSCICTQRPGPQFKDSGHQTIKH